MSSSAPSPAVRNLFSELEELLQTETESRVSARVMAAGRVQAEHLNQSVRRLRQASGFAEIAAVLCDASVPFCHECVVFRVDHDGVTGERRRGPEAQASAVLEDLRFTPAEAAAFANAIESREPVVAICSAAEISPKVLDRFGYSPNDKVHLFPLIVEGNTVGILYGVGTVQEAALELLAHSAALVSAKPPKPAPGALDVIQIAPAPAKAPALDWDSLGAEERRLHLSAQRFARVHVAEMRLYRSEAVKVGREQKDLYSALQEPIDSAREAYRQTFVAATATMADYFHEELLRTLAHNNAGWLGEKYPGPLL